MKENRFKTFFNWLIIAIVALLPIFFVPYIINPLINSKLILLLSFAFINALAFIVYSLKKKSWEFIRTPLTLPLVGFAILVVISSLVSHQYPSKQLLGMGGAYLSFVSIVLLMPVLIKNKFNRWFILSNNIVALILSVLSIFQLFGLGIAPLINRLSVLELPNTLAFSLSGASFITVQFLSVILLSNIFDQKNWKNSLFLKVTTAIIAIALGINIWAILPGGEAKFQSLSLTASANIAKDSLTFTKNALFGYGPDSYGNAYNILKPIWINGLNYWKFTFDSAFNLPLTIVVSVGLIAFLVYLLFLWKTFVVLKKSNDQEPFLKAFILGALVWQFFAPVNLVMLAMLAIALAFFINSHQDQYKRVSFNVHRLSDLLNRGKLMKIRRYVFVTSNIAILGFLALGFYVSAKTFVAYHMLYKSNVSVTKNEVAKAYDYHKDAKILAPQIDMIRRSYSLINLQIAIALSNKADITPAEQEQVLQLVNQAIREAKAATVLDPYNYQNWSVLAQIYMQLLNTTDQAMQEAFNSLAKAATYNPSNPEIRLALGQLFLSVNRLSEAINFFDQTIERKPDLFVAHYYLAQAFKANNQLQEAKSALISGLNLLNKDSEEYKVVEKELNVLISQLEGNAAAAEQTKELAPTNSIPNDQPSSAPASLVPALEDSNLSTLLDQQETEAVIQDGALTSDQNFVEN